MVSDCLVYEASCVIGCRLSWGWRSDGGICIAASIKNGGCTVVQGRCRKKEVLLHGKKRCRHQIYERASAVVMIPAACRLPVLCSQQLVFSWRATERARDMAWQFPSRVNMPSSGGRHNPLEATHPEDCSTLVETMWQVAIHFLIPDTWKEVLPYIGHG